MCTEAMLAAFFFASAGAKHTKILGIIKIGNVFFGQALLPVQIHKERKIFVFKLPPLSLSFFWRRWVYISSEGVGIAMAN